MGTATLQSWRRGQLVAGVFAVSPGQHVYRVADRDEPGEKHARAVLKSLEGIVEWVRWVELPGEHGGKPVKDITDLREACGSEEAFLEVLELAAKEIPVD